MKGLKKLALASAVAAVPFAAQAGMEPLSETEMGNVTGQQTVTIELETAMTIDQIAYSQDTNGSFLVDDIRIGGLEPGSTLDIQINIDLLDSGDAFINIFTLRPTGAVDLGVDVGAIGLSGDDGSATLISNMEMDMMFRQLDITAQVENTIGTSENTGSLLIEAGFVIESLDVDFDVAAVSLRGLRMGGVGSMEELKSRSTADMRGLAVTNPAEVVATIGAGAVINTVNLGPQEDDVLRIDISNVEADIWMPTINVGPDSIGSVAVHGLRVTDTRMAIYGN